MNNDPYDTGIPKYQTAQSIYDALCEMVKTEEMSILSTICDDVSYDNQTYYYTDKGGDLKDKFEALSDFGDKMWLIDLAVLQVDNNEIHDTVYEALVNSDLAKRIGFKKLFIEKMLGGDSSQYGEIIEEYAAELGSCDRFDNLEMIQAFKRVRQARGEQTYVTPYPNFAYALFEKVKGLKLYEHTQLIVECRAHLTSYDDFIFGLRANQALYDAQEQLYTAKAAKLRASYDEKVRRLLLLADSKGLFPEFASGVKLLENADNLVLNVQD